eukprot:CAMPEP_0118653886 /NCGR_PEP_ID=MMETSP0785-20121206/12072_1 /TAXON_ID=91992 /ORGANISM="Bolidomonas pacifica, Strain CCMP 1866" /LENGTH=185 /DNA_ID=CAMNT_0006546463 /DNA_START=147 /DNA_END=700 /DNA_ORIENTATION=+
MDPSQLDEDATQMDDDTQIDDAKQKMEEMTNDKTLQDDEEESLVFDEMTQRYPTQLTQDDVDANVQQTQDVDVDILQNEDGGLDVGADMTQAYPTQDLDDGTVDVDFEAATQKFSSPEAGADDLDPDATQVDEDFLLPPAPPKDIEKEDGENTRVKIEEKARVEAEEKARIEAEEKARIEAEEKA